MFLTALLGLALAPTPVKPKIVAASMFKNGYAVVMREFATTGDGEYEMVDLPRASLGTLWFSASEGTKLEAVTTTTNQTRVDRPTESLDAVFQTNVGKTLTFVVPQNDGKMARITAKLLSASGQVLVIQGETTMVISKSSVLSIEAANGALVYTTQTIESQRALRFRVSGKAGKVSMISLERGLTWVPGYSIDISDKNNLRLIAKSTVVNDLENLDDIEARFITGFPNVPFAQVFDPLTSADSSDAFVGMVNSLGIGGGAPNSRGRAGDMMTQNGAARFRVDESMPTSPIPGQQIEDLYFYRQPNVKLARGERSYYVLFRTETPFKEIYSWDIEDPITNNVSYRPRNVDTPEEVWHSLKFKNTSGQPLTTAAATTMKDGQIIGQDMMAYVPAGGDAEVRITRALDVRADQQEEEVSRERGAVKNASNYPIFDLVTLKSTIAVRNPKDKPITMRIKRDFTGELIASEGSPKVTKVPVGLRARNQAGTLVWNPTVAAGQTLKLTFTYKLYVATGE